MSHLKVKGVVLGSLFHTFLEPDKTCLSREGRGMGHPFLNILIGRYKPSQDKGMWGKGSYLWLLQYCPVYIEGYIYTILTGWEIRHTVSNEGGRGHRPSPGAAGSRDWACAHGPPRQIQRMRVFQAVCIVFISPLKYDCAFLSLYRACFVRVLPCFRVVYLSGHTVYTAPFVHLHARKHMLAVSVVTADPRK